MSKAKKAKADEKETPEPEEEELTNEEPPKADSPPRHPKLPLARQFYLTRDELMGFLFPPGELHPHSTLRLFVFAEYGPTHSHHSFAQCLCSECQHKCKTIRRENEIAKQLFYGKILIGTPSLPLDDPALDWLCEDCRTHCATTHHLHSGQRNLHVVSPTELSTMEQALNRKDVFSCLVSRKEELWNPLTAEEEDELFNTQPLRVKHIPKLSKPEIIGILNKLPTYLAYPEASESAKSEIVEKVLAVDEEAEPTEEPSTKKEEENENEELKEEAESAQSEKVENAMIAVEEDEEEEPTEVLSFYDIQRVVKKVRDTRIKSLFKRSITTQDPSTGPKQRSKALRTKALKYTDSKQKHSLAECELSSRAEALLHTFTHEVVEMGQKKASQGAQNVRLLRYLEKDNDTNWDANCCIRGSNRIRNHGK